MERAIRTMAGLLLALGLLAILMPGASARVQTDTAIRFTFLGCDDGVDPTRTPDACQTPLTIPDMAFITTAPDWVDSIADLPRQDDGSYLLEDMPSGQPVGLNAFYRLDYNYFTFDGTDENGKWHSGVTLQAGETRDVTVYYWNGDEGLIQPGENMIRIAVRGCPDGVDPQESPEQCDQQRPIPDTYRIEYTGLPDRPYEKLDTWTIDEDGVAVKQLPPYSEIRFSIGEAPEGVTRLITGDAEEIWDTGNGATIYALRGETREVTVYVSGEGSTAAPDQSASMRVTLLSCPEGVAPQQHPEQCTESLEDDGTAMISPAGGENPTPLVDFPRDGGAYVIGDLSPGSYWLTGIAPVERDRVMVTGNQEAQGDTYIFALEPGETREVVLYYYDPVGV